MGSGPVALSLLCSAALGGFEGGGALCIAAAGASAAMDGADVGGAVDGVAPDADSLEMDWFTIFFGPACAAVAGAGVGVCTGLGGSSTTGAGADSSAGAAAGAEKGAALLGAEPPVDTCPASGGMPGKGAPACSCGTIGAAWSPTPGIPPETPGIPAMAVGAPARPGIPIGAPGLA